MKKVLSKIAIRVFLIISSIFLALLVTEISLRIAKYQKKELPWRWVAGREEEVNHLFALHSQRIYSLNKNVNNSKANYDPIWASDKLGFRYNPDHDDTLDKKSHLSIVMVGDSFTYGHEIEHHETYPAQVEGELKKTNKNVVIHNVGVPGYGLDQEFLYIRDEIIPNHHPDIIVWNINVNDIPDSNEACLFKEKGDVFIQIPAWRNTLYLQGFLLRRTPTFIQNSLLLNVFLNSLKTIIKTERFTIGCTSYSLRREQVLKKFKFFLNEVKKISQEEGIEILITLVPFQFYFDEGIKNDNGNFFNYQELKKLLSSSEFKFIDTNQVIAQRIKPRLFAFRNNFNSIAFVNKNYAILGVSDQDLAQTLFQDDGFKYGSRHLNKSGCQFFAKVVAKELEQYLLNLIP